MVKKKKAIDIHSNKVNKDITEFLNMFNNFSSKYSQCIGGFTLTKIGDYWGLQITLKGEGIQKIEIGEYVPKK